MGADVQWNPNTRAAAISKGGKQIGVMVGSETAYVDGAPVRLDVAAVIKDGRLFVPLRFIAEALNYSVDYKDKVVNIH